MSGRKVVVAQAGSTLHPVKSAYGDFDAMFRHHLDEVGVEIEVVKAYEGGTLPSPDRFSAAIITGSPSSVTALEPWAKDLAAWTARVVDAGRPFLGVCYGHQLLAYAKGGEVANNRRGYEVGTIAVELTREAAADPLFGGIATEEEALCFHSTHQDVVVRAPNGARILASTPMTAIQAFAIGRAAWGVQFHPEFTEGVMALYARERADLIRRDARGRGEDEEAAVAHVQASIRPTPCGALLLRRFVDLALREVG